MKKCWICNKKDALMTYTFGNLLCEDCFPYWVTVRGA